VKVVVLGTGMIGSMMVRELAKSSAISRVTAVDSQALAVDACVRQAGTEKVVGRVASLGRIEGIAEVMAEADIAIAALPHSLSMLANQAAIQVGCHLIDLVGSQYPEKLALDEQARAAGVLLVTGCGVAPGVVNVLAARGIALMDEADEAVMYCGGLPREPLPPLWYQVVFRLESVFGLYTKRPKALEGGEIVELPVLSGLEPCLFPAPVGECEAVYSDAHSTAYTLKGKVKRLREKTVRYPGHFSKLGVLSELGFLSDEPMMVDGVSVRPRRLAMALLEPQMKGGSNQDFTVVRVVVSGRKGGQPARHEWEMVDLYDEERGYTSMAKTTGFPAVILTELLAEGLLPERGFLTPEQLLTGERYERFMAELSGRGVVINQLV
jgi:lysine 6-dehydrogenase